MNAASDTEPALAVAPSRPKRGGWFSPVHPGPSRRLLAGAVLAGLLALLVWLMFGIEAFRGHDDGRVVTRTLSIGDSGELRPDGGRARAAEPHRSERGLRYAVVRTDVAMPDSASRMRIRLDLPAGVEPETAVLRARTPAAVVRLRRSAETGEPYVDVQRVRSGSVSVDVLVALPSEGLLVDEPDDAPSLASATGPYDENVVEEARSGRRLAWLHEYAWWLAGVAVLLGMFVPIVLVRFVRRRWYDGVPQLPAGAAKPAGPPDSRSAVAAAAITRGSRGVSVPDTFAGQVLELVSRDSIKLRHTLDPRTGEGSVIGIGAAMETASGEEPVAASAPMTLDQAALGLLAAVANDEGDTVQLPDRADRLAEQLAQTGANRGQLVQARADWRSTLDRHLTEYAVVEHPRTRYLAAVALACGVVLVAGVAIGAFSSLDGTSASAWFAVAATLAPAIILGSAVHEQRGWVRVCPGRRVERLRWVAWRQALDERAEGGDARVLPYAVASGNAAGIAPRRAGPTDVGLAAATPELIASLRRVAGAAD